MEINLGDEVQSKITGAVGKVIEISEDRDIKVLEKNMKKIRLKENRE